MDPKKPVAAVEAFLGRTVDAPTAAHVETAITAGLVGGLVGAAVALAAVAGARRDAAAPVNIGARARTPQEKLRVAEAGLAAEEGQKAPRWTRIAYWRREIARARRLMDPGAMDRLALRFAKAQMGGVPGGVRSVSADTLRVVLPRMGWRVEDVGIVLPLTDSTFKAAFPYDVRRGIDAVVGEDFTKLVAASRGDTLRALLADVVVTSAMPDVVSTVGTIYALAPPAARAVARELVWERNRPIEATVGYALKGAMISVPGLRITSPGGSERVTQVSEEEGRDPGKKFWRWAYDAGWGTDAATLVALLEGDVPMPVMPTGASRDAYWTCQACWNAQCRGGTTGGLAEGMVHHGYRRPGIGFQVGDCSGVGALPWELDSSVARGIYLDRVRDYLGTKEALRQWEEEGVIGGVWDAKGAPVDPRAEDYEARVTQTVARWEAQVRHDEGTGFDSLRWFKLALDTWTERAADHPVGPPRLDRAVIAAMPLPTEVPS